MYYCHNAISGLLVLPCGHAGEICSECDKPPSKLNDKIQNINYMFKFSTK